MNSGQYEEHPVPISYSGPTLLNTPVLNKDCAFTQEEREAFGLTGLLPQHFESLDTQVKRAYRQFLSFEEPIHQHIYLRRIQDHNETLFYRLISEHVEEMMPIIYTPVVGEACERFSEIYRHQRGLFISYPDKDRIEQILANVTKPNIKVIVVTDGSRILGLGDQGIGGMGIPIGKLSLYTACGGISPAYTLPITLDVGTNNPTLLNDPLYMGWQHERIEQAEYDAFVDRFIQAVKQKWPKALLQFEDFEQKQAQPLLTRYQDQLCCFNDDIQGTAAVTLGTLIAACHAKKSTLTDQRVVFVGAGSAGCGIAEQLLAHMQQSELSREQALEKIFIVDRDGLINSSMKTLTPAQETFAHSPAIFEEWRFDGEHPDLQTIIDEVKPTVLIGVSGQAGLFSETLIKTMHSHCERPIIFPLSNPSKKIEAHPQDLLVWTQGQAIIATGSPFETIEYAGKHYSIPQCNNSYIFPGIGLGVVAAGITRITDEMLMVASEALAAMSPLIRHGEGALLPSLTDIAEVSKKIAFEIGLLAQRQKVAVEISEEALWAQIEANYWVPHYRHYERV
jgi:malate dehydrogenase (oxaloacetate-decarboxylating)